MMLQLFKRKKELHLERTYAAPIATVWDAWTRADMLRHWWGPEHTSVTDCEIDPRVGCRIYVVMEAGEGMGKYQGTRWPLEGTFTVVEPHSRLSYDARSWTEGEQDTTTIEHVNELTLTEQDGETIVNLTITITDVGPGAKMAAFGMKMGYKAQLAKLQTYLDNSGR